MVSPILISDLRWCVRRVNDAESLIRLIHNPRFFQGYSSIMLWVCRFPGLAANSCNVLPDTWCCISTWTSRIDLSLFIRMTLWLSAGVDIAIYRPTEPVNAGKRHFATTCAVHSPLYDLFEVTRPRRVANRRTISPRSFHNEPIRPSRGGPTVCTPRLAVWPHGPLLVGSTLHSRNTRTCG